MNSDNAMRRQAFSLPELIKAQYEDLEPKTRKVLTTPEIFSIQRIILTGCGDSYAAAVATKGIFEQLTGLPVEVVTAIDLARHYPQSGLGFAPYNPLVIAVSNSGGVARVGEAIARVVKHGGFALGITGNDQSVLAKQASRVLPLDIPSFEAAPGVRSYAVSLIALILMAIRIGEVRGKYTMDTAMDYRYGISKLSNKLEESLPEMDKKIYNIADKWQNFDGYDFVASGSDYAAAWYGHAKVFEAMGKYAMCINTEEWLHVNFFLRKFDTTGTVFVCDSQNSALSRAKETICHALNDVKRPVAVIGDENVFGVPSENFVEVPKSEYAFLNVLTQFAPLALLTGYIGEMIGEEDGRGSKDNWSFCTGGAAIKNSELEIL